jgi:hypothetical protein
LRDSEHNSIVVFVFPCHEPSGLLPAGVHPAEWDELEVRLATTPWRRQLLEGFRRACQALADAGCKQVWLDGSFVTTRDDPGDFDGCWDPVGVDGAALDPVLLRFENRRAAQKAKYLGELFPAVWPAVAGGPAFVDFFQIDKATGNPKGILSVDPRSA